MKKWLNCAINEATSLINAVLKDISSLPTGDSCHFSEDRRTAVHEVGHLITIWFCTHVRSVHLITNESSRAGLDGFLDYQLPLEYVDALWADVVVQLSGIAAEGIVYKKIDVGSAFPDLSNALRIAQVIENAGPTVVMDIPWNIVPNASKIDIGAFFVTRPSPIVCGILNASYRHARHVIKSHKRLFDALIKTMATQRSLDSSEIDRILGPRLVYTFMRHKRPIFVLPP